jgi:hypothetical protein
MGRRRADRSHGVEVKRRATKGPGDRRDGEVLICRICIRYEDDRKVCFVPEAGEEFFSQDDAHRLVGSCTRARKPSSGVLAHRRGTPVRDRTTPRLTSGVVLSWRWLACPANRVKRPNAEGSW